MKAPRRRSAKLGEKLGLDAMTAACGIAAIADGAMSLAVRAVSVNRGIDPRDTAMIAFGGAGPLHAVAIAREISIPKVIVPKLPGNFSALGMLMAAWRQDFVRTLIGELDRLRRATPRKPSPTCAPPGRRRWHGMDMRVKVLRAEELRAKEFKAKN